MKGQFVVQDAAAVMVEAAVSAALDGGKNSCFCGRWCPTYCRV